MTETEAIGSFSGVGWANVLSAQHADLGTLCWADKTLAQPTNLSFQLLN